MQPTRDPRPIRTLYIAIARRAQAFLNFCTAGRLNYWQNKSAVEKSGLFSEEFYVSHYGNLIPPGMSPLKHYLTRPWNTPLDPSPDFDSAWYLRTYPDVAYWRHHPFVDYVRYGRRRGRQPRGHERATVEQLKNALTDLASSRLQSFLESGGRLEIPAVDEPVVSILLLLRNRAELTLLCLESIATHRGVPIEVVIVDNGSIDETQAMLERISGIRVFRNEENTGFGPAGNQAAQMARGEVLLFLNNDTQIIPGAIDAALATLMSSEEIGAVGGKILLLDGKLQEAGSVVYRNGIPMGLGRGLSPDDPAVVFRKEVDYCSACFLLTPRELFLQLGGFHSRYAPSYFEDSDYCLTLWEHGKKVIYEPTAAIVHFESASTETRKEVLELSRRNEAKFAEAHRPLLEARPIAGKFDWKLARFIVAGADRQRRILLVDDFPPVPLFGSGLARANTLVAALIAAGYEVTIAHGSKSHFRLQEVYAFIDRSIEVIPLEDATCAEVLRQRAPYYSDVLVSRPNNLKWVLHALDTSADETPSASRRPRIIYDAEALYAERQRLFGELANGGASETSAPRWTHEVELGLARQADIILSVSPREAVMMEQATGKPVFLVGFSVAPAPTPASWAERQTILFVGSLHEVDSPNYDSLRWFLREVGPLLPEDIVRAAKIVIAGYRAEGLPPLESGGLVVEWIGRQDDLTPVYDAARVFIAPTRYAAGIPYKCVEAASHGVPMVVTQVLADQLEWQHGRDLLVADHRQPAQFAAAIAELYRDQPQWELVRENALAHIAAELSPDVFQRQVEAVFPPVR